MRRSRRERTKEHTINAGKRREFKERTQPYEYLQNNIKKPPGRAFDLVGNSGQPERSDE